MEQRLKKLADKVCSEQDRKEGKCVCHVKAKVGQTNFIPTESTDFECSKRVL